MDDIIKLMTACREAGSYYRRRRRLTENLLVKTKGLTALFLSRFTNQQLFNYYYRLYLPPKHLGFLRTELPVEFLEDEVPEEPISPIIVDRSESDVSNESLS